MTTNFKSVVRVPFLFLFIVVFCNSFKSYAQEEYKETPTKEATDSYSGGSFYEVKKYPQAKPNKKPKNIILLIGDGMGLAQVNSGLVANGGHLNLENFINIGFSKTSSSNNYITDSAAGATALSSGVKTYNGAIGVDPDKKPVVTILEMAISKGLKTGLVATSSITHATPAAFIAHVDSRKSFDDIALDFLKTDIDVFIGGGKNNFEKRKDGKNLSEDLIKKGFQMAYTIEDIQKVKSGKLAGLTAAVHNKPMNERGDMLEVSTKKAMELLSQGKKGFFLMVEGSQIDFSAHKNDTKGVVLEMLDFDKAIGSALEFAVADGNTLIIVTADHETGGMTLNGGDLTTGKVVSKFTTGDHTGITVPIYAFGPGAEEFRGFMENTAIAEKMMKLLKLK